MTGTGGATATGGATGTGGATATGGPPARRRNRHRRDVGHGGHEHGRHPRHRRRTRDRRHSRNRRRDDDRRRRLFRLRRQGTTSGPIDLTGRKALLVVDSPSSMSDGETIVEEVLQERGMVVTVGASTGPASLAAGQNVVVVSDTSGAGDFVPIFGSVAVPMIVFGNSAFQTLGWTASSSAKGTVSSTTNVSVVSVATPLVVRPDGRAQLPDDPLDDRARRSTGGRRAGRPSTSRRSWAHRLELIDFAYEKGSAMATGTAPARRVGLGWKTSAVQNLTIDGFKLFSAAIDWTAGSN